MHLKPDGSKSHYEVLDGLRGTAALSVFLYHLLEYTVAEQPLHYSYLAVDFFFMLSGFVLGHAYDRRLSPQAAPSYQLGLRGFFLRRLIRLHPMVVVGMTIGLIGVVLDPYAQLGEQTGGAAPALLVLLNYVLALFLLPAPSLPDCFGGTHSLNLPAWTLFQEYLANFLFGIFSARMTKRILTFFALLGSAALVVISFHFRGLSGGFSWTSFPAAPVRLLAAFTTGLLIHRLHLRLKVPSSYVLLSIVMIAVFITPEVTQWHGLFDVVCVLIIFPLILMAGASVTHVTGIAGQLCRFTGRLSYPVYIIHYPFVLIFVHWNWVQKPATSLLWWVMASIYVGVIVLAWFIVTFFDEPVRAWLTRRFLSESRDDKIRRTAPTRVEAEARV